MRTLARGSIWIWLTLLLSTLSCQSGHQQHQQTFLQFGTLIDISVIANRQQAEQAFNDIEDLLTQRHSQWHGWMDGELSRFNRQLVLQPGTWVSIPQILEELLTRSKAYYQMTDGLFNPAMGKLIAAWGFHDKSDPDINTINRLKARIPNMSDIEIRDQQARSRHPELKLDMGGIAKGLAIRQIAELLQRSGINDFIINAGGDVMAHGQKQMDRPWRVAIENPFEKGIVSSIDLSNGMSIFTSGNYHRYYQDADGKRRHHIIDPGTGEPASSISSATVLHHDPVLSDVAATTLMLTKMDQIEPMARRLGISDYLVINEQRQVVISSPLAERLHSPITEPFTITNRH